MKNKPAIRTFLPDEWPVYKSLRLRALADAPDAFGSTLEREQLRPDSEWCARLLVKDDSLDLPLIALVDAEPAGLAWGRIEKSNPQVANLYQMWVVPGYRRLGAGKMLLRAVITWARVSHAGYLDLGVTCTNQAAIRLYTDAGFEPVGEPETLRPGSDLLCQPMRLKLGRNSDHV